MYSLSYSEDAIDQLSELLPYYLLWHPKEWAQDALAQIEAAFETYKLHPEAAPLYPFTSSSSPAYRRVNIWHLAFLYRIDEEAKRLLVDRIYHVRSSQL